MCINCSSNFCPLATLLTNAVNFLGTTGPFFCLQGLVILGNISTIIKLFGCVWEKTACQFSKHLTDLTLVILGDPEAASWNDDTFQ